MQTPTLQIVVNGQPRDVGEKTTVAQLLDQMQLDNRHLAVERNRQLVPRTQHAQTLLAEGDQLEVVTLVGGG